MAGSDGLETYLVRARELGALDARVIDAESVSVAAWVRLKCRYGCGGYGSSLCCPPNSPTPEETREVLRGYRRALLIHRKTQEGLTAMMVALERELFLGGHYKAFALGSGPCTLCRECSLDHCAHAGQARPSMEACGIDVFATARANGFPIEVVTTPDSDRNHFGLLLVD